MSKKQYALLLVVALVAGLVGGVGSSWLLMDRHIVAQKTPEQAVEKQPPQTAKVIRTERFEVVDKGGKTRAVFGYTGGWRVGLGTSGQTRDPVRAYYEKAWYEGEPDEVQIGLIIADEGGHPRLGLGFHGFKEAPYLEFDDEDLTSRAALTLLRDGTPSLELRAKDGQTRAELALSSGKAELTLISNTNKASLSVAPSSDFLLRGAALDLTSGKQFSEMLSKKLPSSEEERKKWLEETRKRSSERAEITLEAASDGPSVTLTDNDGKERAVLGQTDLEYTRTGSTEKRSASSLVLFDKDGQVIWQAP